MGPDAEGEPAQKKSKKGSKQAKKDDDSDDDGAKKKRGFVDRYVAPPAPKLFPVYRPKAFDSIINKQFSLPGIKKKGVILEIKPTLRPLGTRQVGEILPAPLFDPLADHAIVLWDPTTDDIEAQRELERMQREKQERDESEDAAASELDRERKKVHKSLAEILGIVDRKKTAHLIKKVAVVIDPRLSSKLRPHQVSGVKFLYRATTGMIEENSFGWVHLLSSGPSLSLMCLYPGSCIMADEMGLGKTVSLVASVPLPPASVIDSTLCRMITAPMHHPPLDSPPPVPVAQQATDRQGHRRLSRFARPQLGQRARQVARRGRDEPARARRQDQHGRLGQAGAPVVLDQGEAGCHAQ